LLKQETLVSSGDPGLVKIYRSSYNTSNFLT